MGSRTTGKFVTKLQRSLKPWELKQTHRQRWKNLLLWGKKPFFSWSGGSTTKAASKTIPVQEERAKVLSAEIKKTDTDLFFHVLRPNKGLSNPKCPPTTFAKTRGVWPVVNNVFNSECVKPETNTR